jgi:hypothetical protein
MKFLKETLLALLLSALFTAVVFAELLYLDTCWSFITLPVIAILINTRPEKKRKA